MLFSGAFEGPINRGRLQHLRKMRNGRSKDPDLTLAAHLPIAERIESMPLSSSARCLLRRSPAFSLRRASEGRLVDLMGQRRLRAIGIIRHSSPTPGQRNRSVWFPVGRDWGVSGWSWRVRVGAAWSARMDPPCGTGVRCAPAPMDPRPCGPGLPASTGRRLRGRVVGVDRVGAQDMPRRHAASSPPPARSEERPPPPAPVGHRGAPPPVREPRAASPAANQTRAPIGTGTEITSPDPPGPAAAPPRRPACGRQRSVPGTQRPPSGPGARRPGHAMIGPASTAAPRDRRHRHADRPATRGGSYARSPRRTRVADRSRRERPSPRSTPPETGIAAARHDRRRRRRSRALPSGRGDPSPHRRCRGPGTA